MVTGTSTLCHARHLQNCHAFASATFKVLALQVKKLQQYIDAIKKDDTSSTTPAALINMERMFQNDRSQHFRILRGNSASLKTARFKVTNRCYTSQTVDCYAYVPFSTEKPEAAEGALPQHPLSHGVYVECCA